MQRKADPSHLGRYTIVERLGAGGMGEVYKAWDETLDRHVAIKVLGGALATDSAAAARFIREAKAASMLAHPNIVTIFDAGSSGERGSAPDFLVMELLEGGTLAERIANGTAPRALLEILAGVARGLARAHAAGIIHRDLKPANVVISRDGVPKIVDFGIAKIHPLTAGADDPTVAQSERLTREGAFVGTVGYAAPEQLRGDERVDHRADIFSFGCILYEVVVGHPPFAASTPIETAFRILREPYPPITTIDPSVPSGIERLIMRSLEKEPANRYQTMDALAEELERLLTPASSSKPRRWPLIAFVAIFLTLAAVITAMIVRGKSGALPEKPAPLMAARRVPNTAAASAVALSPDGRLLALVVARDDRSVVVIRHLTSGKEIEVASAPAAVERLQFDREGTHLYFASSGRIMRVPAGGGAAQTIVENAGRGGSLDPGGSRYLAFRDGALWLHGIEDRSARLLVPADDASSVSAAAWSPDGRQIAFIRRTVSSSILFHLEVLDLSGRSEPPGVPRRIGQPWLAVNDLSWNANGSSLVLAADSATDAAPSQLFEVKLGSSPPVPLTRDLQTYSAVAATPRRLAAILSDEKWDLYSIPLGGGDPSKLIEGSGKMAYITTMNDGRLLYHSDAEGNDDIWTSEVDGRNARRVTSAPEQEWMAAASPDGARIAFIAIRGENASLRVAAADGSNPRELLSQPFVRRPFFSADGSYVYFTMSQRESRGLMRVATAGGQPQLVTLDCWVGDMSPDGERIACKSVDDWSLMIIRPDGTLIRRFAQRIDNAPRWSNTGDSIAHADKDGVHLVDVSTGVTRKIARFPESEETHCDFTRDGSSLLCSVKRSARSVVVLDR